MCVHMHAKSGICGGERTVSENIWGLGVELEVVRLSSKCLPSLAAHFTSPTVFITAKSLSV